MVITPETFSPSGTFAQAISLQPQWVQIWVMILMATNLSAVIFLFKKHAGKLSLRKEAILILASFIVAAIMINIMFNQIGYSRLLGLPHLIFWTPVYVWLLVRYKNIRKAAPLFSYYLIIYFIINAISLAFDANDVVRYFLST